MPGYPGAVRPEFQEALQHLGRDLAVLEAGPLHGAEAVRHEGRRLLGVVDHDRQDERHAAGDTERALRGKFPLDAEIAFFPRLRVGRDDRDEEHALFDLQADLRVPLVAVLQPARRVEPHLDTGGAQGVADALRGPHVLGGVG